ncbi:hypothetical protein WA556_003378 [Blastocystis sp. ATCC 50177/Nand II]
MAIHSTTKPSPSNPIKIASIDVDSLESMPSSESLLYDSRSKLLSSNPSSVLSITPLTLSTSSTASIPSIESLPSSQHIPHAADISATLLTSSNTQAISIKAMEECPELMVVMNRVESILSSSCKRVAVLLHEAIRQREEATLTNEVEIRSFNESESMASLREFEKKKKEEMADLEAWYEAEVAAIEKNFTAQLDQYEKELEEYRSACFVKAEKKEAELDKELKDDPPERAARIRSQVLERYHNKLSEGERGIQESIQGVRRAIQQEVKDVEREYQKRRRAIEKGYARETHAVKEELSERKKEVGDACAERRSDARSAHTKAIEACQDILNESLYQVRDLLRAYEEAYCEGFLLSSLFLSNGVMFQTISGLIKTLHLFCDVRVHEQVKRIAAIQSEIDLFQTACDDALRTLRDAPAAQTAENSCEGVFRADRFLQSTIALQTELIGKALLDIGEEGGFHSRTATLREEFQKEVATAKEGRKHGWLERRQGAFDGDAVKKKYLARVAASAKEELEKEFKHCVEDIVDYAANAARLAYREMAYRYWLLLNQYREQKGVENVYELLTAANQEIIERFSSQSERNLCLLMKRGDGKSHVETQSK